MKNKKKRNAIIVLLVAIVLTVVISKIPYYKIKDRTKDVKEFKGASKENAISWIRVQGTNIDLPVVYYYDSDVSDATYDIAWSFVNDKKIADKTTIFSHNILNVSKKPQIANKNHKRFEQLLSYIYIDFVKENKYIQYTINGENYLYKIYGISFQKSDDLIYKKSKLSKKEKNKYIKDTKNKSFFDFKVDVNDKDKLLTLVTCTRFYGERIDYSFVVDARLVRKHEMVGNYKVIENKKYKKIKKIMNGADEDA